jgi:hypothetical protein
VDDHVIVRGPLAVEQNSAPEDEGHQRVVGRQLFDHLVSAQHYRWGYSKPKRLGGLEVQDHLRFCRKLNG